MKWNPTLALGHPRLDRQLRQIFQLLEILQDHQHETVTSDAVSYLFSQLNQILAEHCNEQEALLVQLDQPEPLIEQHRSEHNGILELISQQMYDATFACGKRLSEILLELELCLHQHFCTQDLPLRALLQPCPMPERCEQPA